MTSLTETTICATIIWFLDRDQINGVMVLKKVPENHDVVEFTPSPVYFEREGEGPFFAAVLISHTCVYVFRYATRPSSFHLQPWVSMTHSR